MLGYRVYKTITANTAHQVFTLGRSAFQHQNHIQCDIADGQALARILKDISPDYVVHCAANVNLESCEREKDYTYRLHVVSSRIIASDKNIARSIFISTDSVFDGKEGSYTEDKFVAPLNYYALTKALAEECFLNAAHPSVILRTNMFGFNNPVKQSLFEWAYSNLKKNVVISGFSNVYFNPLYIGTIAKIVEQLLMQEQTGLVHIGCKNGISKYEFLLKVATVFGFPHSLIQEVQAQNNNNIQRPFNTILSTQHFETISGRKPPDIDAELQQLLSEFISH